MGESVTADSLQGGSFSEGFLPAPGSLSRPVVRAPGNSTSNRDAERAFFRTRAQNGEVPPASCA